MIGRSVLHYAVTRRLGRGASGEVYLATDERTGHRVALKVLDEPAPDGRESRQLLREAQAISRLSHPGVVSLHGLEECEGQWILIEEYIEGETLAQRLSSGPLGPHEVLRMARELSSALAHAHSRGVLHRDIKPANIMVAADGTYKLTDFGIARVEGATTSASGKLLGTMPYMAPERIRGHRGDARSDLFSLGAVLYEAMTDRRAFGGASEAEIVYAVLNEAPRPFEPRSPGFDHLAGIVRSLLAKEPGDRVASAEVLAGMIGHADHLPMRRGRAVRWVWVGVLLMLGISGGVFLGLRLGHPEPGPIAVLQFRNTEDPVDGKRLGLIASNLLAANLATTQEGRVLSTERVLEAMQDLARRDPIVGRGLTREIARRTGATWVVTGNILRTQPLVMTAEVTRASDGKILGAVRMDGKVGQTVFDAAEFIGFHLSLKLQGGGQAQSPPRPVGMSTRDLDAQRMYVEGLEYLARGESGKAEIALQKAVALAPDFEAARLTLTRVYWLRTVPGGRVEP